MNTDREQEISRILAEGLQKAIDADILMSLTSIMPKLVFRPVPNVPLHLEYAMEHGPGTFTPTGMRPEHTKPVLDWCSENECGIFMSFPHHIIFRNEAELAWFLLRWT